MGDELHVGKSHEVTLFNLVTMITRWSRKVCSIGGSPGDVQSLARHFSLQLTQRYIDVSEDAMAKAVE